MKRKNERRVPSLDAEPAELAEVVKIPLGAPRALAKKNWPPEGGTQNINRSLSP